MLAKEQIDRINELAKKAKTSPLNDEELKDQKHLRQLYIESVKKNLSSVLDNTSIKHEDGSIKKLKKKTPPS